MTKTICNTRSLTSSILLLGAGLLVAFFVTPQAAHAQTVSEVQDSKGNTVLYMDEGAAGIGGNGFVGVNRSSSIGAEVFGVQADVGADEYGGMYMETTDADGKPFYGYATDGAFQMWTEYEGSSGNWTVVNGGDRLTVRNDGFVGVNRKSKISNSEEFGVQAVAGSGDFGGMYMETTDPDGQPFYGYAVDGSSRAFTWLDPASNKFKLNISGTELEIDGNGDMTIQGTLTESSDRRLKTSIEPVGSVLDALNNLQPVHYRQKESTEKATDRDIGLIAQEVQKEFPELVHKGSDGYLSLSYSKLSAVLLKGFQEQQRRIENLKAENERMKERLTALEKEVSASSTVEASFVGVWGVRLALVLCLGGLVASLLWRRRA